MQYYYAAHLEADVIGTYEKGDVVGMRLDPQRKGFAIVKQEARSEGGTQLRVRGVGFGAGKIPPATSSSPPPPPLEARTVVPRAGTATPTPKATALSQEPLTLQEKRQRQELRIEKDKLALELRRWQIKQDELQIKQDEQRLGELRRMETERGGETVDAGVTQGAKRQDLESP